MLVTESGTRVRLFWSKEGRVGLYIETLFVDGIPYVFRQFQVMDWLDVELYSGEACSTIFMGMVYRVTFIAADFLGVAVIFYNDVLDTIATVTITRVIQTMLFITCTNLSW